MSNTVSHTNGTSSNHEYHLYQRNDTDDVTSCKLRDIDVTNRKLRHAIKYAKENHPDEPIIIIDPRIVEELHVKWRTLMPRVKPFYAVKVNPDPVIVSTLAQLGCSFDCASIEEMDLVLRSGGQMKDVIYANPTKIPSHISGSAMRGVDLVVFDNEIEIEKLEKYHPKCRGVLRIANKCCTARWQLSSKHGAMLNEVEGLLKKSIECNVHVVGVSFHVGCGCTDTRAYSNALHEVKQVFEMAKTFGMNFTLVDIGGGFPGTSISNPTIEEFAVEINKTIEKLFPDPSIKIIAELGSYFAKQTTGILLAVHSKRRRFEECINNEIEDIAATDNHDIKTKHILNKDWKGKFVFHYYLNDGRYGNLLDLVYQSEKFGLGDYYFFTKNELKDDVYASKVWGPTCDSIDMICENHLTWPELQVGDYIFMDESGAYNSAFSTSFNGMGSEITKRIYVSKKL